MGFTNLMSAQLPNATFNNTDMTCSNLMLANITGITGNITGTAVNIASATSAYATMPSLYEYPVTGCYAPGQLCYMTGNRNVINPNGLSTDPADYSTPIAATGVWNTWKQSLFNNNNENQTGMVFSCAYPSAPQVGAPWAIWWNKKIRALNPAVAASKPYWWIPPVS